MLNEEFNNITDKFFNVVKSISEKKLNYKLHSDYWTIREHIIHVCDSEINSYI